MFKLWLVLLLPHFVLPEAVVRPYKFAFNIKGYQHRREERDERGIIKGEYGFITADGYYRTTVYETDEKGRFHIVSTKNTYVGFPPDDPVTTTKSPRHPSSNHKQPHTFGSSVSNTGGQHQGAKNRGTESPKTFTRPQGIAACSDCFVPTKPPPRQQHGGFNSRVPGDGNFGSSFGQKGGKTGQPPQSSLTGNVQHLPQRGTHERGPPRGTAVGSTEGPVRGPARGPARGSAGGTAKDPARTSLRGLQRGVNGPSYEKSNQLGLDGRMKLNPDNRGFGPPGDGNKLTHKNQLGDALYSSRPKIGEVEDGLPPGVTLADISDLLYSFNYSVKDYGQQEDGYRNGDKIGDYYFGTKKGIKYNVAYVANEFGYQPNITYTREEKNDDKPYEQSDNELNGYEFKWFYRK